jgi:hypothetical protein
MIKFLRQQEYLASRFGFNICHKEILLWQETDNPEKSFNVLATSNQPWAVKFREHLKRAHGFDIAQSSMQLNEVAVNWKE